MIKGFIYAALISLSITAVWYVYEYKQFGELQWDRECDSIVSILYFIALWIAYSKRS